MAYKRVNWENLPSTKTPVNADNLNKMEEIYVGKEKPVAGEKVWFRKGKNLFDKSKALTGYWIIDEQGNIGQAGDRIFVTDFIPVFKDVPVYIPATGSARREFYNKNKVGTTYLNNAGAQVFTPTEDGFIRVTCNVNAMDSLMIYYGTTETEYEAYIEPQIFVKNSNGAYEEIANAVEKTGDTMTGDLNMQSNSVKFGTTGNVLWKEDGYEDKFRIIPDFNGAGSDQKLIIQSTTGEAGTDPQNWKDLVYIHADTGEVELAGDIGTKSQIVYDSWHNIILTRTDQSWLYLILYGSNLLKKGNYSIADDFKLVTYGTANAELTIPRSAIKEINREDWGFVLIAKRSEISGDSSEDYNGIAIVSNGKLILQST